MKTGDRSIEEPVPLPFSPLFSNECRGRAETTATSGDVSIPIASISRTRTAFARFFSLNGV